MVQVVFGGDTKNLDAAAARAKTSVSSLIPSVDDVKRSFGDLSQSMQDMSSKGGDSILNLQEQLKGLNDTISKGGAGGDSSSMLKMLLGGTIVGGAAAGAVEMLRKVNSEMLDLQRNAREAGLSLQKFQEINYAANAGGVSNDKFVSGLQEAEKKLNDILHGENDLSKFLDANNVKYKDANGHLIATDQYLQVAAALVRDAGTEGDRFKAAEILGFSREWVGFLERGPVAMRASIAEAHRVGAVLSDEMVNKAAAFEEEWRKTSLQWAAFMKSAIISVTTEINELIKGAQALLGEFGQAIVKFRAMSDEDFGKQEIHNLSELAAGILVSGERLAVYTERQISAMAASLALQAGLDDVGTALGAALGPLNQTDQNLQRISISAGNAKNALKAFSEAAGGGGTTKFPKDDKKTDRHLAETRDLDAQITAERTALESKKQIWDQEAQSWQITANQKALYTEQAIKQAFDAEMGFEAKKQALFTKGDGEWERVEKGKALITERYSKDMLATVTASQKAMLATTEQYMTMFTGAFDAQLMGVLQKTQTWQQAMQKMAQQLFMDMIREVEKWAVKKAAVMLTDALLSKTQAAADVAAHASAEAAKTAATVTGVTVRTGAEAAATGEGLLMTFANAIKSIFASAGQTSAGVSAAVAPESGPAAPAIGAAAGAAVLSSALTLVPSAAVGGYVMNSGLAMVHARETIVPANIAQPYGGGGGAGGGDMHVHIHAWDGANVQHWLKRGGTEVLLKAFNAKRTLSPSLA